MEQPTLPPVNQVKDLPGTSFKLHVKSTEKGGLEMEDEGNVIPAAVKELVAKIASKAIKGNLSDVINMPAPASIHHYSTHLHL